MPNTRITRQKWKDHFSYAKKVYIIGILLALGAASLIYSVTRYQAPQRARGADRAGRQLYRA